MRQGLAARGRNPDKRSRAGTWSVALCGEQAIRCRSAPDSSVASRCKQLSNRNPFVSPSGGTLSAVVVGVEVVCTCQPAWKMHCISSGSCLARLLSAQSWHIECISLKPSWPSCPTSPLTLQCGIMPSRAVPVLGRRRDHFARSCAAPRGLCAYILVNVAATT